jgi:hypothetical protein
MAFWAPAAVSRFGGKTTIVLVVGLRFNVSRKGGRNVVSSRRRRFEPASLALWLPASLPGRMENEPHDFEAIRQRVGNRCFICEMLRGNPEFRHHVFYEDDTAVAWLNKYPNVYGYVLVAPQEHREAVTGDYAPSEYSALQEVVRKVGEAVRRTVETERLYVLSVGSQRGVRGRSFSELCPPPGRLGFAPNRVGYARAAQRTASKSTPSETLCWPARNKISSSFGE